MQLSEGTKICIYLDYEEKEVEGLSKPAIVRFLCKEWSLTQVEIEQVIKEQEEMLEFWETKGEIV